MCATPVDGAAFEMAVRINSRTRQLRPHFYAVDATDTEAVPGHKQLVFGPVWMCTPKDSRQQNERPVCSSPFFLPRGEDLGKIADIGKHLGQVDEIAAVGRDRPHRHVQEFADRLVQILEPQVRRGFGGTELKTQLQRPPVEIAQRPAPFFLAQLFALSLT
jgi:hypothetical protein